jgi:hypothetical protein
VRDRATTDGSEVALALEGIAGVTVPIVKREPNENWNFIEDLHREARAAIGEERAVIRPPAGRGVFWLPDRPFACPSLPEQVG